MGLFVRLASALETLAGRAAAPAGKPAGGALTAPGHPLTGSTERGTRASLEQRQRYLYQEFWVDPELAGIIQDIRRMDALDGRVKKIHARTARMATKGGIRLVATGQPRRLEREWDRYVRRLGLTRPEKLESDMRGQMMEGNLALQWVLDAEAQLAAGVRMPVDTLVPRVGPDGQFTDPARAYEQIDLLTGGPLASFGLYQLTVARLQPQNYDDWGCWGRPYLDATRRVWKQLSMTEEDLVIRRRTRAPQRMAHVLEGATQAELSEYQQQVERDQQAGNWRDYYMNKRGTVTAVAGDANLEQIADVAHLLDTFYAGSPAPRGLFGYTEGIARDILEDLKKDYFDELAAMQVNGAWVYEFGFRLHLLLQGINDEAFDFSVAFAERLTDTPNQRADLALKLQALGASRETVFEASGLNATHERAALEKEAKERRAYQEAHGDDPLAPDPIDPRAPTVSITPGNERKGESGTAIST